MIIKKCETKGAYEAIPDKSIILNLDKVSKNFKTTNILPMLLMLEIEGHIVTCYKNGKLLIRDCDTEEEAEKIANMVYSK